MSPFGDLVECQRTLTNHPKEVRGYRCIQVNAIVLASEARNVPRIGLMERVEGDEPSAIGIESPMPSEYARFTFSSRISCTWETFRG